MKSITDFIERKLGLIVNAEKSKMGRPKDIKFLGLGYFYDKQGKYYAKPQPKSILKLKRKLKALCKSNWSISLDIRIEKLRQLTVGWINYFHIAKMKTVCTAKVRGGEVHIYLPLLDCKISIVKNSASMQLIYLYKTLQIQIKVYLYNNSNNIGHRKETTTAR